MTGPHVERFVVSGLGRPVEVVIDEWGVPHIFAESKADVFIAQGFNAARDRLFQIDLWRRRGLGQLAEVFGRKYAEQDRAARLFLYRGDMHAEWLAYGSGVKAIATAFVTGVNSYVSLCEARPELLPPEFRALGYMPARWSPEDVARIRSHGLFHNVEQEVARARTLAEYGSQVEDLRRRREPDAELAVPDGLDIGAIPPSVLQVYQLALSPAILGGQAGPDTGAAQGSNNWVIAGSRTATGRPIVANDPHRSVSLPSLRYLAHLNCPGMNVIGAGEPALPGISVGHNERVAFGFTIFAIDQEDLYVYETAPGAPHRYRYKDGWESMEVVRDEIHLAGSESIDIELRFTRHGPVIWEDPGNHRAFAVRAAWLEPGMAPYLGSVEYMQAQSAEDFATALDRWGSPGENQVYADVDGRIGWQPAGLVPIRPNWDGTLPVPGDGRYEWAGFYDRDQLPSLRDPACGWIATANEMNLPADFPNRERTISYDWYPPYRYERIAEVLTKATDVTVQDCLRLQTDYASVPARRILKLLAGMTPADPRAQAGWNLLSGWDGREDPDSAAAALFEIWYRRHLRQTLLAAALRVLLQPADVQQAVHAISPNEEVAGDPRSDLALLERIDRGELVVEQEALERSLADAVTEATGLLGDDISAWRWGSLHQAYLVHPAAPLLDPAPSWATLGPLPRGGSGDTVSAAAYSGDFVQLVGATFRVVMDVGEWDNSVAMNSPGQSGNPESPHYADLFGQWAEDGAFPLVYSRREIEKHAAHRYVLVPEEP
ncbi:MAG: penicillin acylase family protein [Streptosporangiaceae bacterium]